MATLAFHAGTYAEYVAKKTASQLVATDLYFTTDAPCRLFRGANPVAEAYTFVDADPEVGEMMTGVLYINSTTGKITALDGEGAISTILPTRVTTIEEGTDGTALPTVAAIKSYVQSVSSGGFTAATYENSGEHVHSLKFTTSGGTETYVALPSGLANVQYDPATGKFTFTKYDGSKVEADTPLEKVLTDASYDSDSHILSLTFNVAGTAQSPVQVDLSGLVDSFTVNAGSNSPIAVSSSAGVFSLDLTLADASLSKSTTGVKVALSADKGNALSLKADGLFVATPEEVDLSPYATLAALASTATAQGASLIGVNGTFAAATKTVQGVLADHETRIGTAETDIAAIEGRLDTAEGDITTLEGKMSTAEGKIETLTTNVTTLTEALTWKTI